VQTRSSEWRGSNYKKSNDNPPNAKQKYKNGNQGDTINHMWHPLNPQNNPHNPNTMIATLMVLFDVFITLAMAKT
jgi:hypothetical protein